MKVDLHVHASERSGCSTAPEEQQIQTAIAAGLDAIAFTDHNTLVPEERLIELNAKYAPFRIFTGIEITSDQEDFVVLGIHDYNLESPEMHSYPFLHAFVRRNNGYIFWAHPFRFRGVPAAAVAEFKPDAMEIRTWNTPYQVENRIRETAIELSLPVLCNSDAHQSERLGQFWNVLKDPVASDAELVAALKAGRFSTNLHAPDPRLPQIKS